jgi:hypothetical protein
MEPRAYSLPLAEAEPAELKSARRAELKCLMCGLKYLLLIPPDARYPDQTYRDELMWRMGIDCPAHPAAVVWDANFTMPTAVWKPGQDSAAGR